MKFSIKAFFNKCDQIRKMFRHNQTIRRLLADGVWVCLTSLLIWSHLLKKSLMENFIFCALLSDSSTSEGN